jgi:hypothetical protein
MYYTYEININPEVFFCHKYETREIALFVLPALRFTPIIAVYELPKHGEQHYIQNSKNKN